MPLQPGDLVVPQVFADIPGEIIFDEDMRSYVGAVQVVNYRTHEGHYRLAHNGYSWIEESLIPVHPMGYVTTFAPGDMVIPRAFADDDYLRGAVGYAAREMDRMIGVPCEVRVQHPDVHVPSLYVYTPDKSDSWIWPVERVCAIKAASAAVIPGAPPQPEYATNDLVELTDGTWMRVVKVTPQTLEYTLLGLSDYRSYHPESDIVDCVWSGSLYNTKVTITAPLPDDLSTHFPVGDTVTVITRPTAHGGVWSVGVRSSNPYVYDQYAPVECLSGFTPFTREGEPQTLFDAYAVWQAEMDRREVERRAALRSKAKAILAERIYQWSREDGQEQYRQVQLGIHSPSIRRDLKNAGAYRATLIAALRRYPERMDVLGEALLELPCLLSLSDSLRLIKDKRYKFAGRRPDFIAVGAFLRRPELIAQVVHISEDDPLKVAYYPSIAYMKADRCIRTTVGRYLTKFCSVEAFAKIGLPGGMTELEIKRAAEQHRLQYGPVEVKWAYTREECIRAVAEGPTESCMSNGYRGARECYNWYEGHLHPAAVYGTSDTHPDVDTAVAYLEDADGIITARAICNKRTKRVARGYGDYTRLIKTLAEQGWLQEVGALAGARLALIEDKNCSGHAILPYVDAGTGPGGGNLYVRCYGNYLIAGDSGVSTYLGYEKDGSVDLYDEDDDRPVCDLCGGRHDEDDSRWSEYHERIICDNCIGDYEYAWTDRRTQDWIHRDLCYEYDREYYTADGLEVHDLSFDEDGNIYPTDELVETPSGTWHEDVCVKLDVPAEGGDYEYASKDDVVTTHDGRTIYDEEATTCTWHDGVDYILHKDDDPEDYLPKEETIELAA